jgi:hypothetical protein
MRPDKRAFELVATHLASGSPCCAPRALHRRCDAGVPRASDPLQDARRCRPTHRRIAVSHRRAAGPPPARLLLPFGRSFFLVRHPRPLSGHRYEGIVGCAAQNNVRQLRTLARVVDNGLLCSPRPSRRRTASCRGSRPRAAPASDASIQKFMFSRVLAAASRLHSRTHSVWSYGPDSKPLTQGEAR